MGGPVLAKRSDRVRLLLAVHTMCPCSSATLKNILGLSQTERNRLDITIVVTGPGATPNSSAQNVCLARSIQGANLVFCSESEAVRIYHARTSGQAFIYALSGKLVFSGGLTESRGTQGDSVGMNALHLAIQGKACPATAPVYGCALETPQEKA